MHPPFGRCREEERPSDGTWGPFRLGEDKKTDPIALQIPQRDIDEALRSVERASSKSEASAAASADPPQLRADLLEARQALRQREAELELSQQMSRQTLDKLKEEHDRALRALADLDNVRKRASRERDEHAKFNQEKLLRELLPVLDNLDRALEHAGAATAADGLAEGIRMTRKLLEEVLARQGVRAVESLREPFDPRLQEAMQSVESAAPPGTVVAEMVRGYTLHDRLLRPAMVVVSRAAAADKPEAEVAREGLREPLSPSASAKKGSEWQR